jgi:protein-L-isoaspartate O-methyltransferase
LILPVGDRNQQILTLIERVSKDKYIEEKLEEVLFVPLLKGVVS